MMQIQDQKKSCIIKEVYIQPKLFNELSTFGTQGTILDECLGFNDVQEAFKYINLLSLTDKMYPELPMNAFSYCDFAEIKCVIVGSMPDIGRLNVWTGSAFCYNSPSNICQGTILHDKIVQDCALTKYFQGKMSSDLIKMQDNGVLLLNEALSVTKKDFFFCKTLWRPIIARVLAQISISDNKIPFIFTTVAAFNNFKLSVINSDLVLCLNGCGEKPFPENPNIFDLVENHINRGATLSDKIKFLELITL
jgi:uracil DNA glycosylase